MGIPVRAAAVGAAACSVANEPVKPRPAPVPIIPAAPAAPEAPAAAAAPLDDLSARLAAQIEREVRDLRQKIGNAEARAAAAEQCCSDQSAEVARLQSAEVALEAEIARLTSAKTDLVSACLTEISVMDHRLAEMKSRVIALGG
jgi:hypothetical protein